MPLFPSFFAYNPILTKSLRFFFSKAVDLVQEHVFSVGPQNNETAVEQAKDKAIADGLRTGYKSVTEKDIPI